MMKSILAILLFALTATSAVSAQTAEDRPTHSSAPHGKAGVATLGVGIHNKLRVKGEFVLARRLTLGGYLTGYYAYYPGLRLEPMLRVYLTRRHAPEGLYLQAKPGVGIFTVEAEMVDVATNERLDERITFGSPSFSGGLGYQFLLGKKKNIVIDLALGLRLAGYPDEDYFLDESTYADDRVLRYYNVEDAKRDGDEEDYWDDLEDDINWHDFSLGRWLLVGPGSLLDGTVSVGFAF